MRPSKKTATYSATLLLLCVATLFLFSIALLVVFVASTPAHATRGHVVGAGIQPPGSPPLGATATADSATAGAVLPFEPGVESISWWGGTIERPKPVPLDEKVYPNYLNLFDVVTHWNPDNPDPPPVFRETLAHFNYSCPRQRAMAEAYRNAELPFKVYDVPDFDRAAELWTDEFLSKEFRKLGSVHVERSDNNHFMYWTTRGGREPEGYTPPTEIIADMSFDEWVKLAYKADKTKLDNATEHFYLMSNAPAGDRGRTFISRDLRPFTVDKPNFFITNPPANKGIQCRLAMRGVISEAHYDSGRNMVAMLSGVKRYVLNPPSACKSLKLIPDVDHPSYRHSIIDWSDPAEALKYGFDKVQALDTLLRKGEVLYIPTGWNHYIIALMYSMQCNSRSGSPPRGEGLADIEECMGRKFPRTPPRLRGAKKYKRGNI